MFEDETKIFNEVSSFVDGELLHQDLVALKDWSKKWFPLFHPEKAKVLHLGKSRVVGRKNCAENKRLETIEKYITVVELEITFDKKLECTLSKR